MKRESARPDLMVDARWIGVHGIGRFASEVLARLPDATPWGTRLPLLHPVEPLLLHAELRRRRPRLYFTPGFNPPYRSPVPVVMTLFDLIHLHVAEESGRLRRAYYEHIVRPAAQRGAPILTTSQFTRGEILTWARVPEDQVHLVGAGVADAFRSAGARHAPGYPYVLYVGNHKPHKNLPRLVQAFAGLPRAWGIRFLLTGPLDEVVAAPARHWGVLERIVALGTIAEPDLPAYYRGASVFVLPSLYEGFGLPVLEAMACGVPVVAAAGTALPEVAGDAALLVDAADATALCDALRRVLEDGALRARLAAAGPARARRFSWDEVAARVRTVLATAPRASAGSRFAAW